MTHATRHISTSIRRSASDVYAYISNPENLPEWAAGLSGAIRKVGDDWVADSPMGEVTVKFAEPNALGVLDHEVTLPDGMTVSNPMRVFPNGDGSELVFTLFRLPSMTSESYRDDAQMIEEDPARVKRILESKTS